MSEIENLKIYGGATYTVGNQDIIANEWEAGVTYVKGKSYVIREHKLYVCNVTHTSVEPFDVTKWTEITVGEAIAANTTAIGTLSTLTTTVTSSIVGAVNEVNNRTPKIQYGYVNAGYCGANAVTTATINYSGFTTAPKIIACLDLVTSQINNTRDLTIAVNEDNVTPTTAEIDIINLSSALYAGFNWIAIGN